MPPTRFPMLRGALRTRASTNSISRDRKTSRLQGRISAGQRIGKFLALPDKGIKIFFIFRIDKIIIAVALRTVRNRLEYGDDFILCQLRERVELVKGTIKTLDKAAIAGRRMKSAYVGIKDKAEQGYNQIVACEDVAVLLDIRHSQIAVFLFKAVLQIEIRAVPALHDSARNLPCMIRA